MKQITIAFILGGLLSFFAFKSCTKPKVVTVIEPAIKKIEDKRFDKEMETRLRESERYEMEIARLTSLTKNVKSKYIFLNKEVHDTIKDCTETINQANDIIVYQDSLIIVYYNALESCNKTVESLQDQVKFEKEYSEIAAKSKIELLDELKKFKHIVFRIYRKSK